jgi:osmoprotectant transport system permease protein
MQHLVQPLQFVKCISTLLHMEGLKPPTLWQYVINQHVHILSAVVGQIELVVLVMTIASIAGILIGMFVWNSRIGAEITTGIFAFIYTIPSFAMIALLLAWNMGLGWRPSVIALVLYAPLSIIRNTIVGMRSVTPAIMESARAMGMGKYRVLFTIQLPLAWPVIITGIRIASMNVFNLSAVAAYILGPGLGDYVFTGLQHLGSFNSLNQVLVGVIGITVLALLFDAGFVLLRRVTTSRGLRV